MSAESFNANLEIYFWNIDSDEGEILHSFYNPGAG
jgi:hypothetical protein